jgi:putative two-component system response regulator
MRIIIVSDHQEQVASLRAFALDAGLEQVEGFTHPAAALDWCAGHEPDLVLVDYVMRACDGLEFLRRFRAMPHLGEVPIVLMLPPVPGLGSVRATAWKLGVTDFLAAPVDHTEFVARVRNLLLLRAAARVNPDLYGAPAGRSVEVLDSRWLEAPPAAATPSLAQFH